MPTTLSLDDCKNLGITFSGKKDKGTGVLVFSLIPANGTPYSRLVMPAGCVNGDGRDGLMISQNESVQHILGDFVSFGEDEAVDIPIEEFANYSIKVNNTLMDNGEYRFRLMGADGSGYIRTVMSPDKPGEWQNAHYHGGKLLVRGEEPLKAGTIELICVEKGWVGTADLLPDGTQHMGVYEVGNKWISQPGVAHNIFQASGSTTHCIKYGSVVGNPEKKGDDWWPAPDEFDAWTKSFDTPEKIFGRVGLSAEKIAELNGKSLELV